MKNRGKQALLALALTLTLVSCAQQPAKEGAESKPQQRAARLATQPQPALVTVPAGTELEVRLVTGLDSKENKVGDTFRATLENPLVVGQRVVIPKGAEVGGQVTKAVPSGRLKQRAELWVTLTHITVKGKRYNIATTTTGHKEGTKATRDIIFIGGGAGAGAAIGGAAGGGKGAAIGTAIGAGAGTAAAMLTGKRDIKFPPETLLRFRLEQELKLRI